MNLGEGPASRQHPNTHPADTTGCAHTDPTGNGHCKGQGFIHQHFSWINVIYPAKGCSHWMQGHLLCISPKPPFTQSELLPSSCNEPNPSRHSHCSAVINKCSAFMLRESSCGLQQCKVKSTVHLSVPEHI